MLTLYYSDAQKLGQKEFRACTANGQYPYLPALDEFISTERLNMGIYLGAVQIPTEFIVGTRTAGRTRSFARNFMPLMEDGSEFAAKWKSLCKSHLEEGVRDPIKVYEYMNRYYVEEGNKRVSVLKFFGANTIYAEVIRVLPERNGAKEVELYYEFIDFYKYSRVNYIEFTKPGSYARLQRLLGKKPEESWSDEDRSAFAGTYSCFRQAYERNGGGKLSTTVGDALLTCINIYGYPALRRAFSKTEKMITSSWEEIALQQETDPIDVKMTPQDKKPGLFTKVLSSGETKEMKVAFVYDKTTTGSAWTNSHEEGRQHVERVFGDKIQTKPYFNAMESDPLAVIEEAIAEGNTVIFTTSPRMLPASLRAAVDHPKITILNCSLNTSHRYIRTYYARMYEAKFVIGAMAGALAGGDDVGYLCDYPIYGQIAGINAFALGVQMVNPRAKVYLEWSTVGGAETAVKRLTDRGIRLISSQDLTRQGSESWVGYGLSLISGGKWVNLAYPVWQWGRYYEAMLRHIRDRSFKAEYKESGKALNYYWGMSAGVVELGCTEKVPPGIRRLAEVLQDSIRAGLCEPFKGKLYTKDGRVTGGDLTPEQIIRMDWLSENVVGTIPAYEELTDLGKATVDMVGVEPALKDKRRMT